MKRQEESAFWRALSAWYDGKVAEKWFQWFGWLLATAAMNAVAKVSGSTFVSIVALVSMMLLFTYIAIPFERFIDSILYRRGSPSIWLRILAMVALFSFHVSFYIIFSSAIESALQAVGTAPI